MLAILTFRVLGATPRWFRVTARRTGDPRSDPVAPEPTGYVQEAIRTIAPCWFGRVSTAHRWVHERRRGRGEP
jgi:hypothetical protein